MAGEFDKGFAAGWLAASQALVAAMNRSAPMPSLDMAGNKPSVLPKRRGRPPKALAMPQPVKRGRGRPRNNP